MPTIDQQIVFFYTADLLKTAHFYEHVMGLRLARDQGTCRIYHTGGSSYIGFCQRDDWPILRSDERPMVIFTLVTDAVDEWYEMLTAQGVAYETPPTFNPRYGIYHSFLRDPNGYLIEIQRFDEPLI